MRENSGTSLWEEYLNRARRALYDGEPDIAITHADQILQADPENTEARQIREEAVALRARTRGRWKSFVGKVGAQAAKIAGLGKKAVDELRMQHRAKPTDWRIAVAYADACLQSGRVADGRAAYLTALGANEANDRFLERGANYFRAVGDPEHEVAFLRRLFEYSEGDPNIERRLRNAEANLLYQRESKHKPMESRAEKEREKSERKREKDLQARIEQAVKVYRDHPEDMRNRVWLARLLLQSGGPTDIDDATHILERVLEEDPENADGTRTLADLHRSQGRLAEALKLYEQIAESRKDDLEFLSQLADLKEEYYRARLEKDPDDTEAAKRLKEIEQLSVEREVLELEQRVKMNPNDPDLALELGDKYREQGRLDDAISRYQQAARSPLRRFRASMRLGDAFVSKQKPELAVLQYEKALEAAPSSSHGLSEQRKQALYALGQMHEQMDNIDAALECYQEIYAEDIGFEDVSERFETMYTAKRKKEQESEAS
jgi:tetratricopeptide (TPR) repeat protein